MVESQSLAVQPAVTPKRLKIEMVLAQLYVGGMEVMVSHLMRALRERGHSVGVTCILDEGPLFHQLHHDGFRTQLIPTHGWHNLVKPRDLTSWLETEKPDVLHIHSGAWIKTAIAAHRAGIERVIFTHHGLDAPEGPILRTFNWFAARHTHRIVAVSEDLKRTMLRRGGIGKRRIDVLPNGVPTDTFAPHIAPANLRNRFGVPDDGYIVGNVARMFPVKNHLGLVEAFAELRKRRDDVYLVLVGDGPLRDDVERSIVTHRLTDSVFLTGEIDDLPEVYRAFDVFALPSHNEGTSISILEAMACGTAVVATAVGGNPQLLAGGEFGTLVAPESPEIFADALDRILNDGELRNRLAVAGRERVIEHHSVNAMCDAYETLYYNVNNGSTQSCAG